MNRSELAAEIARPETALKQALIERDNPRGASFAVDRGSIPLDNSGQHGDAWLRVSNLDPQTFDDPRKRNLARLAIVRLDVAWGEFIVLDRQKAFQYACGRPRSQQNPNSIVFSARILDENRQDHLAYAVGILRLGERATSMIRTSSFLDSDRLMNYID